MPTDRDLQTRLLKALCAELIAEHRDGRAEALSMLEDLWLSKVTEDLKPKVQQIIENHLPALTRSVLLKAIKG